MHFGTIVLRLPQFRGRAGGPTMVAQSVARSLILLDLSLESAKCATKEEEALLDSFDGRRHRPEMVTTKRRGRGGGRTAS